MSFKGGSCLWFTLNSRERDVDIVFSWALRWLSLTGWASWWEALEGIISPPLLLLHPSNHLHLNPSPLLSSTLNSVRVVLPRYTLQLLSIFQQPYLLPNQIYTVTFPMRSIYSTLHINVRTFTIVYFWEKKSLQMWTHVDILIRIFLEKKKRKISSDRGGLFFYWEWWLVRIRALNNRGD